MVWRILAPKDYNFLWKFLEIWSTSKRSGNILEDLYRPFIISSQMEQEIWTSMQFLILVGTMATTMVSRNMDFYRTFPPVESPGILSNPPPPPPPPPLSKSNKKIKKNHLGLESVWIFWRPHPYRPFTFIPSGIREIWTTDFFPVPAG